MRRMEVGRRKDGEGRLMSWAVVGCAPVFKSQASCPCRKVIVHRIVFRSSKLKSVAIGMHALCQKLWSLVLATGAG